MRPGVLMVTGAYYPEVSGGGLQCRALIRAARDRAVFTVLTTSANPTLSTTDKVDGTPVYRVAVDVSRLRSKLLAAMRLAWMFIRLSGQFDIVHLHGFSRKNILLTVLAKLFRRMIILTLHTGSHDEPLSVRLRGRMAFWSYSRADLFIGVSHDLQRGYYSSGLPKGKFCLIPNGVDLERFRPVGPGEQRALRRVLGLDETLTLILFVGFFSREKCPDVLFKAWTRILADESFALGLIFIGATRSHYYEIDSCLAQMIQAEAQRLGVEKQVIFVEATLEIEKYFRAVDIFVLPSRREGLPTALLEAMATGLPCVASKLDGVTSGLIDHGVNGLLVPSGDVEALEGAIRSLMQDPARARALGRRTLFDRTHSLSRT
jgi:glycosyltransferase involved in cell wall biosynthesis